MLSDFKKSAIYLFKKKNKGKFPVGQFVNNYISLNSSKLTVT